MNHFTPKTVHPILSSDTFVSYQIYSQTRHFSLEMLHDVEIIVEMSPSLDMGSMFFRRLRSKDERKCEREIIDVLALY